MWIKITQGHYQFKQFLRFCQIKKMSINSRSSTDHKTARGGHGSLKHLELNTLTERTPTIGTLSVLFQLHELSYHIKDLLRASDSWSISR